MRRTFIIGMMSQAMLICIANVSIMPSMYLPSQSADIEYLEVESLNEGGRGANAFWDFSNPSRRW